MNLNEFKSWCSNRNGQYINDGTCSFVNGDVYMNNSTFRVSDNEKWIETEPSAVAIDVTGRMVLLEGSGEIDKYETEQGMYQPHNEKITDKDMNVNIHRGKIELTER